MKAWAGLKKRTEDTKKESSHGLYIHWPWCKKKCPYCDFNSHVAVTIPEEDYLSALLIELRFMANHAARLPVSSIFFGGGTPSLMRPATVAKLITKVEELFGFTPEVEITLEANPTSAELGKFKQFAAAGVNRISVGMQSLEGADLHFLGREHTKNEALAAIEAATAAVNNVNLDLIYGLPHQSPEVWQKNLAVLLPTAPQHISCYQLTIEKNTAFYAAVQKGRFSPISAEEEAAFYTITNETLAQYGYEQYEVSNYAKAGYACKHNTHIWRYGSYLGVGAGAHGRTQTPSGVKVATQNYKMPQKYMAAVAAHGHGHYEENTPAPKEQLVEMVLMGLRLQEGVPLARLTVLGGEEAFAALDEAGIALMRTHGFLSADESTLKATPAGFALLNSVLEHILKL